jgi:hypothetical protein
MDDIDRFVRITDKHHLNPPVAVAASDHQPRSHSVRPRIRSACEADNMLRLFRGDAVLADVVDIPCVPPEVGVGHQELIIKKCSASQLRGIPVCYEAGREVGNVTTIPDSCSHQTAPSPLSDCRWGRQRAGTAARVETATKRRLDFEAGFNLTLRPVPCRSYRLRTLGGRRSNTQAG